MHLGVKRTQKADHAHMLRIIGHGNVIVLGPHEIDGDDSWIGRGKLEAEQGLGKDQLLRRVAEDLIDVARLDLAGGSRIGFAAMLTLPAQGFRLVPEGAGRQNIVGQSLGQQLVAQRTQIVMPSHAFGDVVEAMPGGRLHQLEILLVLPGGAGGNLMEKIAGVARIGTAEFRERSEEMVVPGHALGRDEAPHGEGVDQSVIKVLFLGDLGRGKIACLAYWRGRGSGFDRLRFGESFGGLIHAETVLTTDADEGFGIYGAVQMIVQVGALRHAQQEVAQSKRVGADLLQLLRGALFGTCRCLRRSPGRDLGQSESGM